MAEEQTVETVQDPTTTVAPAAPDAPTPAASGPWSQDLATYFEDESARTTADRFVREKVQPYITRVEQQARGNEQALNLWNNFEADPINTYVQVTHELLGEELANEFLEFAQQKLNGQEQQQQPVPTQEEVQQQMALSPEDQAAIEWARSQQVKDYYAEQMSILKAKPENQDLLETKDAKGNSVIEHIHPWVKVAEGDFDRAAALLRGFVQEYGVPQSPIPAIPDPPAPNAFGSDTATSQASTTPTEPKQQSINDAIDDFMREDRERRAAPPMGAV